MVKGRTVVLKEYLKPMEIQEYEVPDPEPGAIVVRITQAGLCGSDLHDWRGDFPRPLPPTGKPMGPEGVGVIHSLGQGVTTDFMGSPLKEGDRVVFAMGYTCGRCHYCLGGDHNLCPRWQLNYRPLLPGEAWAFGPEGGRYPYFVNTYADYTYLPPQHPIFKTPDELADEEVVSLNCALGTVFQGLKLAQVEQGQTVVLQGVGGLGLYAVALAQDLGAGYIIAIDGQEARLNLARELGANETININELKTPEERVGRVMELTGNQGADVVVELVGLGELVAEGVGMLRPGGTFVEIGNLMPGRTATFEPRTLLRSKRIVGSIAYRPAYMSSMLEFVVRNHRTMPLRKIISHKFALADINDAFTHSEWSGNETPVIRSAIIP